MTDDGPDPIAEVDQLTAALNTRATVLYVYFHSLTTGGFQRTEALELVRDYQVHLDEQAG
jgi:hypothetical protein